MQISKTRYWRWSRRWRRRRERRRKRLKRWKRRKVKRNRKGKRNGNSQSYPVNSTTSGKKTWYTRGLCGDMSHHMFHSILTPTSSILLQRIQWTTEKSTGVNLDLWQQRLLAPINKCLFWIPPRSWCKALGWNHLSSAVYGSAVVSSQSPEEEIQNHWGTPSLSISFLVRFHIHGPENRLFYMNTPSHPAAELD
jgi:hypothetical protein